MNPLSKSQRKALSASVRDYLHKTEESPALTIAIHLGVKKSRVLDVLRGGEFEERKGAYSITLEIETT